jgi:hypothetical protein
MSHSKDVTECKNLVEYDFIFLPDNTYIHWVSLGFKDQKRKKKKKKRER